MSLVVVRHRAGASLLQGEAGLGPVKRLDLALLVDGQDDGVRRWINIEPDHIPQLVDEPWIVRELELPDPVRLEPMRSPNTLNRTDADANRFGHHGAGPVRRFARRVGKRQSHDPLGHVIIE